VIGRVLEVALLLTAGVTLAHAVASALLLLIVR
jgi:hypothetical protein